MAVKTFQTRIKLKYDESSNWGSSSLVLLPGEIAIDSSNYNFKIGDGVKTFGQLNYVIGGAKIAGYTSNPTLPSGDALTNSIAATDTLDIALAKLQTQVSAATTGGITGITMNGSAVTVTNNIAALGNQVTTFAGENGAITIGNGLQMTSKEVSVKVDSTNANGLSVGSYGLALATVVASTSGAGGSNGAMTAAQAEKLAGIATGAQVNVLEGVQVNGSDLAIDANKKVNVTVAEGTANGTIKVNGSDVAVHGLGSAAYTDSTAYEAAFTDGSHNVATMSSHTPGTGEIATQKIEFFDGTQSSGALGTAASASETLYFKSAVTAANPIVTNSDLSGIVGAMVYKGAVNSNNDLPSSGVQAGWTYVVATAGTYAGQDCEVGDMIIAKDSTPTWNIINGENQVTNASATITAGAGSATTIAIVDGTAITAQVNVTAGSATIASKSGNIITLNTGVTQGTNTGTIANTTGDNTTITLADVAATGDARDITVDSDKYGGTSAVTTAQAALDNLATAVGNVNTAIADLDATVDAEVATASGTTVATTSTTPTGDFKVLKSVTQKDGELSTGTAYNLKKLAATGAAEDVSLADSDGYYTATTVEGAFEEIAEWLLILDCGTASTVNHTA